MSYRISKTSRLAAIKLGHHRDLTLKQLTPYVSQAVQQTARAKEIFPNSGEYYVPEKIDAVEWVKIWKEKNPAEYDNEVVRDQEQRQASQTALPESSA
jgi:hypothetical protein